MFADATTNDIASQLDWLAPQFYDPVADAIVTSVQAFLIRTRGKVIIVDTCSGDCKERKGPHFHQQNRNWLGKLVALGVPPDKVDYVLCTHLHVDHVGWNTRLEDGRWMRTFPNARYLFVHDEWEYWRSAEGMKGMQWTGDYMTDSIEPIMEAGLVDFVRMDHELLPEVRLIPAAGHTPGLVCVDIRASGKRLVLAADLLHSPLQCVFPEWSSRFCADPRTSARTRIRLLSEWAANGTLFMPTHFPAPSAGVIERKRGGFSFRFAN